VKNFTEENVEMNRVERFASDIKLITIFMLKFIWFKTTGQQEKAQNCHNWMLFFWNCKPEKVYKIVKVKKED